MAEKTKTPEKPAPETVRPAPKLGGLIIVGILFLISLMFDQGTIFQTTLPSAWTRVKQVAAVGGHKSRRMYWHYAMWLRDHAQTLQTITIIWWVVAALFIVGGMAPDFLQTSASGLLAARLIGIFLIIGYFLTAAGLSKVLYYGAHALLVGASAVTGTIGGTTRSWLGKLGVETKVPDFTESADEALAKGAARLSRIFLILAVIVAVFGSLWVSSGRALTGVHLALLGLLVTALALVTQVFPKSIARSLVIAVLIVTGIVLTIKYCGEDLTPKWISDLNRTDKIIGTIASVILALAIASAFWKTKSDALVKSAKYALWASLALIVYLSGKGVLSAREAFNLSEETSAKVRAINTAAENRALDAIHRTVAGSPGSAQGSGSNGAIYMAPPPAGDDVPKGPTAPKQEAPKDKSDAPVIDPTSQDAGSDDQLKALGY